VSKRVLEGSWKEVKAKANRYPDDNIEDKVEKKEDRSNGGEALKTICGGNCCYHISDTFISSVSVIYSATRKDIGYLQSPS
jgi:hypothetical protein